MPPVHFTETCATLTEAGFGGEKKILWEGGHFEMEGTLKEGAL